MSLEPLSGGLSWSHGGNSLSLSPSNPPLSSVCRARIKPMRSLESFLSLLALLPGSSSIWAFHFDQLPSTITAFQPQTLKWIRDDPDHATFIKFAFLNQAHFLAEFGTTTVPETQREGQIPFTFTYSSISTFRIEGLADKKYFTAQPTEILTANPTTTPTTTTFDSSMASTKPPPTTWNPDLAETSPPDSEPSPVPTATPPASTADSTHSASIIGGAVGGGGGAVVFLLFIAFLLLRRRKNQQKVQDLEQVTTTGPHSHSQPPAPIIEPYPMAERSPTSPVSTVKGQSPTTERCTTSDHYKYSDPRDPSSPSGESSSRRAESSVSGNEDRDGPSAYAAVQAQMRMMMQRLERIESADPEAPPDYVSSYSDLR
ncbi:hypothetical protein PM082_014868 [Marasmius tenuissimus]|nr:hypothetical protein PM082_014868 [Marasmius tenuissimus]